MLAKWWFWVLLGLVLVFIYDVFINKKHTILHNFPIVGHIRYWLESIGPELRQYIVANNREELPFNRSDRSWIYSSAKKVNNYQGFGTDKNLYENNYLFIKPDLFPFKPTADHPNVADPYFLPSAKVIGLSHNRKKPFRPYSIINISAMSFGSLSAKAITALNLGAKEVGCFHNTGEGGLSSYHSNGADVMFQFGTGYYGVRNSEGMFEMDKLVELCASNPFIKAVEVKLSQGAKPGKGGVLPGKKITAEIAGIRGVEIGKDVISPAHHTAFSGIKGLVNFIEEIAEKTGLPVGIKSAVGRTHLWRDLAHLMKDTNTGPDFIAIDGGEGGTGAAPPSFADHMSLPFIYAFADVYKIFQEYGLTQDITFIGAGKLGLPSSSALAFALGADVINVAREAMLSIGCIQAQQCHNNSCPSGIATQKKWLQAGIDVSDKSNRFANYVRAYRKELIEITHSAGHEHPCQFRMTDIKMNTSDQYQAKNLTEIFGYTKNIVPFEGVGSLWNDPMLAGLKKERMIH